MRRRVRKEPIGMALFPFLAVLICTMGALVVLLVLLVQQAKVEAETVVANQVLTADSQAAVQERQLALEDAQWRQQVLEKQRQEKQQELSDRRLALSHIEDHIRRLEDAARTLMARLKDLDEGKVAQTADLAPLENQLAELRRAIAQKQLDLADKRKKLAGQERAYALVPYEGRSGTRRMPLYIECVEEGVILQPEGLLLTAADFDGPKGPGNPLDAALRAKREYLAKVHGGPGIEPYPLLVVRPSGVMNYNRAREAMKSWDDEFGYELVAEELKLDFGECDVQMDQVLRKSVRDARRRQELLAASMPRQYRPVAAPSSFSAEELPQLPAEKSSAPGRGVGSGSGGTGVGRNQQYADGRAARQSQQQPTSPSGTPSDQPPGTQAPKVQHGGNARQEGVQGGVAGAKSGKSVPSGMAAQRRGANWGLPNAQGRSFGVTRPIRVICLADRLALLSDRRDSPRPQEIPLSPAMTAPEVDAFVRAIQKQMEEWGLAAENAYWKPELHVEVAGDADARYEELRAALQGSGIEVQRKLR